MSLVKTVTLQVTGEIRDAAAKIGLIARDAQALADKSPVEIKAELTGDALVKEKLASIDRRAEELKKKFPEFTAKIDIGAASAKLAILRAEIRDTGKAAAEAGSSGGGFGIFRRAIGGITGAISGGGGGAGLIGSIGSLIGGAGAGVGLLGLVAVAGQVAGALSAAALGLGSFAALAAPTLMSIHKGYSNITKDTLAFNMATTAAAKSKALQKMKADWASLDPGVQHAVKGIQGFVDLWHKLAKALEPDVLKIFNTGLGIANKLLPDLLPFAKTAANAIEGLLRQFDKFASSAGFKAFLAQMLKMSGPAITALGEGFGKIAIAIGKFLLAMATPQGIVTLNRLLGFTADAIGALSWFIQRGAGNWQKWIDILHQTANKFDELRHNIAAWGDRVAGVFIGAAKDVANWHDDVLRFFNRVSTDISSWVRDVIKLFRTLKDGIHFLWDQVEILTLRLISKILGAFSHIPFIGHFFKTARDGINAQLHNIEADSARTWGRVAADMAALHGKKVALTFSLDLPAGVSFPSRHIKGRGAKGIKGADAGTWLVGEEGPELAWLPQGTHVLPAGPTSRIMGGLAGGTLDSFSARFPSTRGLAAAFQAAIGDIAREIKGLIGVLHVTRPGGGFGVPGPGGGAPAANAALARRMFPSVDFPSWNYVAMRESGWNQFATNPVSGAYGIPQALPPSKMGPAANPPQSNPAAQISWMVGYMNSRYGGSPGAAAHERASNWYDSGVQFLPPGPSLAWNGTGRPERVGGEEIAPLLRRVIQLLEHAPQATGAATANATTRALNGLAARVPAPRASAVRGR